MRKILLALFITFCFSAAGFAQGPYLVCDPYPSDGVQPEQFVVVLNGTEHISQPVADGDGLLYLRFDLVSLWADGPNEVEVRARSLWGDSTVVPFAFVAGLPASPGNVALSKN